MGSVLCDGMSSGVGCCVLMARVSGPRARRRASDDISSLQKLETAIVNSESPIDHLTKIGSSGSTIEFRAMLSATGSTMKSVFDRFRDMVMQKFDYHEQVFFRAFHDR
jgi:hypothetical protein